MEGEVLKPTSSSIDSPTMAGLLRLRRRTTYRTYPPILPKYDAIFHTQCWLHRFLLTASTSLRFQLWPIASDVISLLLQRDSVAEKWLLLCSRNYCRDPSPHLLHHLAVLSRGHINQSRVRHFPLFFPLSLSFSLSLLIFLSIFHFLTAPCISPNESPMNDQFSIPTHHGCFA